MDQPRKPATSSSRARKAPFWVRAFALIINLAVAWVLFLIALRVFDILPLPRFPQMGLFLLSIGLSWALPRYAADTSLGSQIWQWNGRSIQVLPSVAGIFLTLLSVIGSLWVTEQIVFKHPLWIKAEVSTLDPYMPFLENSPNGTTILPFFYSLGAWPSQFNGRPVFHTLPYAKGPPSRFAGHIIARWETPEVQLVFEGPRSPTQLVPPAKLRHCLTGSPESECIWIREETLSRHIEEIRSIHPGQWELSWVIIRNPALPDGEQTQGIYLRGSNEKRGQDRFILVTPKGTQQAFVLHYSHNATGRLARDRFLKGVRSLRASDDLAPGRAWVEKHLQDVKLDAMNPEKMDPFAFAARMAEVQALLVAKISVDPKTYDSFYHLAGTSLLLAKHAARLHGQSHGRINSEEWSAVAKPMLLSAYRYAQDIGPRDPRTQQIQNFWLEAQKF